MKIPEYVTKEEVQRVCQELGISDWTSLETAQVSEEEAERILDALEAKGISISVHAFHQGLEVELEHGTRFADANVTNNHPLLTGRIVLAHLKETMDYYVRLEVAEIEGDLLRAVLGKHPDKIAAKYRKLVEAQAVLNQAVAQQLQ